MNTENFNTILLIDDDEDDCYLFESAINDISKSLKVKFTHNTDHLSLVLDNTRPSIIFVDLHLPKRSGIECLKLIRSYQGLEDTPVIFWSGTSNAKEVAAAFSEGASYYFEKPYSLNELVTELDKILHKNSILSEHEHLPDLRKNSNYHFV
jgi:DNA-binding NtrC family response regulator